MRLCAERIERAAHVVGDGQEIAGERADAVRARIRDFALGAAPQILHFGKRAQQPILELGRLLDERSWVGGSFRGRRAGRGGALLLLGRLFSCAGGSIRHRRSVPCLWMGCAPDIRARKAKIKPPQRRERPPPSRKGGDLRPFDQPASTLLTTLA